MVFDKCKNKSHKIYKCKKIFEKRRGGNQNNINEGNIEIIHNCITECLQNNVDDNIIKWITDQIRDKCMENDYFKEDINNLRLSNDIIQVIFNRCFDAFKANNLFLTEDDKDFYECLKSCLKGFDQSNNNQKYFINKNNIHNLQHPNLSGGSNKKSSKKNYQKSIKSTKSTKYKREFES